MYTYYRNRSFTATEGKETRIKILPWDEKKAYNRVYARGIISCVEPSSFEVNTVMDNNNQATQEAD